MKLDVIILAAGQGKRMKSRLPKVLHVAGGMPLLEHVILTALGLEPAAIHVVIGHGSEQVREALAHYDINWVMQEDQLGTGHAVLQALPHVSGDGVVLVLYGDVPLIRLSTLQNLVQYAQAGPALLTAKLSNPRGYGRVLRDAQGALVGVIEDKDATLAEREIQEVNTGLVAAPLSDFLQYLPRVKRDNQQGEYYLPDVLSLAVADGKAVASCAADSELEVLGVNDRVQLNQVEREHQRRLAEQLMREGVNIADPARLDIRGNLSCGEGVSIDINVVFEGQVTLGNNVSVGPNCVLSDVSVAGDSVVHPMSHLQQVIIGKDCSVGPYARLRPGTVLSDGARIGNFVETKKAKININSKVNHLSYIGDTSIGKNSNIGAGTITCNYDGVKKSKTKISDNVFIGSNSSLVAPVKIDKDSVVGAGSVITKNVKKKSLAITRSPQVEIRNYKRTKRK